MPAANLSAKKKRQWQHVYDSAKKRGADEASAHKQANAVVSRSKKDLEGDELTFYNQMVEKGWIEDEWVVEGKRLNPEEAGYKALGGTEARACLNCHWFIPQDDACVIVGGDIYHTGISDYWMAKEEYHMEPMEVVIVGDETKESKGLTNRIGSWLNQWRVKNTFQDTPRVQADSEIVFYKDVNNRTRFFTRYSNCFKDREGEFISTLAHKEFSEWCNTSGFRPELWIWHTKGSRIGKADFVGFADGFAIASGLIDDTPFATSVVKALSDGKIELGASHGYLPIVQIGNTVFQHRTFEITVLPRSKAANPYTDYNWLKGKQMGLSAAQKEFFKTVGVTDDQIEAWSQTTEQMSKALLDAGLEYKELDDDMGTNAVGLLMAQQAKTEKAITDLAGVVKTTADTVTELKKSDDDKIADKFKAANDQTIQPHIASQSDSNIVDKSKAIEDEVDPGMKVILQNLGIDVSKLTGVGA